MLLAEPGLRPAPYFASRGMKWIQLFAKSALSDNELRGYLQQSYALVGQGLPKKIGTVKNGGVNTLDSSAGAEI
jgi:predicted DNA-binding protein (MmcQ/YjbR family)